MCENQPKLKKHRLGLEGDRCREPKKANPDSDPNVFEIVSSGDEAGSSSAVTHSQPQSQHRFFRGDTMQSLESEVSWHGTPGRGMFLARLAMANQ